MSLEFESVKLGHVGAGGIAGETTFVEEVEAALRRVAQLVAAEGADGPGSITAKIRIERAGEDGVVIAWDVSIRDPRRRRRALSAVLTGDGDIVTTQHRQEALPFNVRPINSEKDSR